MKRPTSKLTFKITAFVVSAAMKAVVRLDIRGRENIPLKGPVIAVCNHLHLFDPAIHIVSLLPRDSIFLAKEELFNFWRMPFFYILMKIVQSIPVARRGAAEDRDQAVEQALEALQDGMILGIFPEGTRSKTGSLNPPHPGAARLALRTGAPIMPMSILGTEKLRGTGWFSRPRVILTFGKTFYLPPVEGTLSFTKIQKLSNFIMDRIRELLPAGYQGNSELQNTSGRDNNGQGTEGA